MSEIAAAIPATDRAILSLTRLWCFVRHPLVCLRTGNDNGIVPDPATPVSYVDKFLWRKIFDHNPAFMPACDKLASKAYALSVCPDLQTAKVLWSGRDAAQIPTQLLAGNVVVKANHGCRWNIMIRNGNVDTARLHRQTSRWVRRRFGRKFGEWAYRGAVRCIFVEEMLLQQGEPVRLEYKFHLSNGVTEYVYASRRDSPGREYRCHFDRDGRYIQPAPDSGGGWIELPLPASFSRMREIAERLTAPFDRMRCDFYDLDGTVYFSEFAVYPLSGRRITNPRLDELSARRWDLRRSWFLSTPQRGWRKHYAAALRRWLDATASADKVA